MQRPRVLGYVRPFLVLVTLLSATVAGTFGGSFVFERRRVEQAGREAVVGLTGAAARQLDQLIEGLQCDVARVASILGDVQPVCEPSRESQSSRPDCPVVGDADTRAERCLEDLVRSKVEVYGASISWATGRHPGAGPDGRRSTYLYKSFGRGELTRGSIDYDYTDPGSRLDWFTRPVATGRAGWSQPYFDDPAAGGTFMVTYSVPFGSDGVPVGVVTLDISSDQLREIIHRSDLGPSGYGALTTAADSAIYIYHPQPEYLSSNLLRVAEERDDRNRVEMRERVRERAGGMLDHTSTTTGESSWLVFEPVPTPDWSLQITFIKSDLPFDSDALRRDAIVAVAAAAVLLSALLALALGVHALGTVRLWILSSGTALFFLFGMGITWSLALDYPSQGGRNGFGGVASGDAGCDPAGSKVLTTRCPAVAVTQQVRLETFMETYRDTAVATASREPVFVAVGISIEALHFLGGNEVSVAGRLWQRVPVGAPEGLEPLISIGNASSSRLSLLGVDTTSSGITGRWSFDAVVAQSRASQQYPIEREDVELLLRHDRPVTRVGDSEYRVYLVPDLGGYAINMRTAQPGLDPTLTVPGWDPQGSAFYLRASRQRASLGIEERSGEVRPPELLFTVVLERDFLDAFISNLTAIIVVALMLFAVLMVSAKLDYGRALSICVGMFFVIAFSHIDLRQRLAVQEVFYLEWFYFILYGAILWVSLLCILTGFNRKIGLVEFRDRLLPKVTFWPLLLGFLFAVTIRTFV